MALTRKRLAFAITALTAALPVTADHMEELIIEDKPDHNLLSVDTTNITAADAAQLLRTLPGANSSSLGTLTGIAQYRGLAGDRVLVTIDGGPAFSGGPNAMDAPLSYAPAALLESLTMTRGIASLNSGQETLGGHIEATLNRGKFADTQQWRTTGAISARYQSVNDSTSSATRLSVANNHHKFTLLASVDSGNDAKFSHGTIDDSQFNRSRYDVSYGYQQDNTRLLAYLGKNNTEDTGTPALAMDIDYIDTTLAGFRFNTTVNTIDLAAYANWSDVEHGMNNFAHRPSPMMAMDYRTNSVDADKLSLGVSAQIPLAGGALTVGVDRSRHNEQATLTNPNNALFEIANFNHVSRDIDGLYAEWLGNLADINLELGVRHNRAELNGGDVNASGMMAMMAMQADMLADRFNSSDRNAQYHYTDLVFKADYPLTNHTAIELGLARKHRAPSYQESYLWLPLPITGGLADGRSYIGNLNLQEERANEITLGLNWNSGNAYFTPQLFFRDINNYIQGTPSTDMTANMLATMMSGAPALQYNNVDAELYGLDAGYGYQLNDQWRLDGNFSFVQGQRTDTEDYLYRIAPTNHRIALNYQQDQLGLQLESVIYASQGKVSATNNEQKTAGYGLLNLRGNYQLHTGLTLSAGVENLFNKGYQDHLAGYNRVSNSDIALGERLYGNGRNLFISVQLEL